MNTETVSVASTENKDNLDTVTSSSTNLNANSRKGSRSFKVKLENNGLQYGRYNGDSPYQAANKALSEIIRNRVKNNQSTSEDITFFLVESTKGCVKKTHQYLGKRIKLERPVTYTVNNGQLITKEFKNILRKVKKSELQNEVNEPATVTASSATETVTSQ
jgi:hypothetical protein